MLKRRYVIMSFLVSCLTVTVFMGIRTSGTNYETKSASESEGVYDPWCDINDDGWIDWRDLLLELVPRYNTYGTPINKTELLLGLQDRVDVLEAELATMNASLINIGAKIDSMATAYNISWATNPVQVQIYGSPPPYVPIPDMTVQITLNTTSFVKSEVSAFRIKRELMKLVF